MVGVVSRPGCYEKLNILSTDAQYDLACACGGGQDEHRRRGREGKWIYPVTLPNGGKSVLFKTLISNVCSSDCSYCPLRQGRDIRRCSLKPQETAEVFMDYFRKGKVFGLFLSSGVTGTPDSAMQQLTDTAAILRKRYDYRGYIHLKIIPGASDSAVGQAVSLASAVSLNIETPGAGHLARLSRKKDYMRDIVAPMKLISKLTAKGARYSRVKQTTQFIVGAAGETDAEIVRYAGRLYDGLKLARVYFSAYQRGLGESSLPGEQETDQGPADVFKREHRLYQVDFLMRKYGFSASEIVFDAKGGLSATTDPKQMWANMHSERFPVDINKASRDDLLRVPGLGLVTVEEILSKRRDGRLRSIDDIGKVGVRLSKASRYVTF